MTQPVRLILILIGSVLVGMLVVLKWEAPPADRLADAEKAVNDARSAGVPSLLVEEFAKLEGLLAQAKKEIQEQNSKLGFLRSYAKAEELLAATISEAVRLIAEAGKRRDEAKAKALQAQQAAREAVMLAQDLIEEAPGGKERQTLALIKADVEKLGATLSEVQAAVDSRDYQAAEAKANDIREKADGVAAEVRRAIDKVRNATGR